MSRFGFISGTYTQESQNSDCERSINWFQESVEPPASGKSAAILLPTPGLALFCDLTGAQIRGIWTINGRTFAVCDAELSEIFGGGAQAAIGPVNNDGQPVSMVASPQQLAIASGGILYVYYLRDVGMVTAGSFIQVSTATFPGPVTQVGYSDGFFIALIASTEQYFASTPFDAASWPGLSTTIISTFPDNVVSMIVDHRQIWLLGAKASEVDYDAGTNPFPFASVPGGFVEQGCASEFATVQLDNSIFWIGSRNDLGNGIAWRANGYVPQRISNHAVERAWQNYVGGISDARAFAYQDGGHSFWQINFPKANATWCYDVATGLWHERGFWNSTSGMYEAALPQCHTFNFGRHLVGDRKSGKIYTMSIPRPTENGSGGWDFVTDAGAPIRRLRRAPIISSENEWMYFSELTIDVETGLGPTPPLLDGSGNPREPVLSLRYSNDSAHTWSNYRDIPIGAAGQYGRRCVARRLGRSRQGRVFEVTCSDPVPVNLIDAYVTASPGFQKGQERYAKQVAKIS